MEWLVYLLISAKPATKLLAALRKNLTVLIMLIVFIVICFICLDNAKVGQFLSHGKASLFFRLFSMRHTRISATKRQWPKKICRKG